METKVEAIKALVKAQQEMGRAIKSANNPHFKSKYADLSSVREACFPALNQNGFAILQPNGVDDTGEFVETIFLHETGAQFSTRVYVKVGKNDMQGYGSAMTYARRYGLLSLSGLAPEDDDGHAASQNPPEKTNKRPPAPQSEHQQAANWIRESADSVSLEKRMDSLRKDKPHLVDIKTVQDAYTEMKGKLFPGDEVAA